MTERQGYCRADNCNEEVNEKLSGPYCLGHAAGLAQRGWVRLDPEGQYPQPDLHAANMRIMEVEEQLATVTAELGKQRAWSNSVEGLLESVTAERDQARNDWLGGCVQTNTWADRAKAAEAQVAVLRDALRAIQAAVGTSTEAWHLAEKVLLNPSPAAERLLLAEAVAKAVSALDYERADHWKPVTSAVEAWRKAQAAP